MFYNCESLTSLNLYNSGTIELKGVRNMFTNCTSLSSINLSNFDLSNVLDMGGMFRGCKSLKSVDLSHCSYQDSNVADYMFWDCPNLEYINLGHIHFCSYPDNINNFQSTAKNIVFCTECTKLQPLFEQNNCAISNCTNNWRKNQLKINTENNTCVTDCFLTNNKYNYNNKCFPTCPNGTYNDSYLCNDCHSDCKTCEKSYDSNNTNCKSCINPNKYLKFGNCVFNCANGFYYDENDRSIKICKCDLKKCFKCSEESLKYNLCLSCNDDYYPKYNDKNNNNSFIDCYQSPEGYYLDKNNN